MYHETDNRQESKSIQDRFLSALKLQKVNVAIYLTNGIKLQGQIIDYDNYVLILKNKLKQKVFKHAIATIVPSQNISLNGSQLSSYSNEDYMEDDDEGDF